MSGGTAPVHHEIPVSDLHLMIPPYRCEDVRPAKHNKAWEPEEHGQIFALSPPLCVTLGNSLSPFVSFSLDSKVGLREAPLFYEVRVEITNLEHQKASTFHFFFPREIRIWPRSPSQAMAVFSPN